MNENRARRRPAGSPRLATPADIDPLARLLASAFRDDPISDWVMGAGGVNEAEAEAYFRAALALRIPKGGVRTAPDLGACADGLPPGAAPSPSGYLGQAVALTLEANALDARQRARAAAIEAAMQAHHPAEPHYYLGFIAVAPDRRGLGLGSALLGAILSRMDAVGAPVYLENSNARNAPFYARAGFLAGDDIAPPGAPPLVPMWRPARRPDAVA